MLKYGNKEFRNLEEQVEKNKSDIEYILEEEGTLNSFGIKVVNQIAYESDLPDPTAYSGDYGDCYALGMSTPAGIEGPWQLYVFTRPNAKHPNPYWFPLGQFPLPGPQGVRGPQGIKGPIGRAFKMHPCTKTQNPSVYYHTGYAEPGDYFIFTEQVSTMNGTAEPSDIWYFHSVEDASDEPWLEFIQNIKGPKGDTGTPGNSITSVTKTSSAGLTDYYTIQYSSSNPTTFTIVNGKDGRDGVDGLSFAIKGTLSSTSQLPDPETVSRTDAYLVYVDGEKHIYVIQGTVGSLTWTDFGKSGVKGETGNGISSVQLVSGGTDPGAERVYQINYTDGDYAQFSVYNGTQGPQGATGSFSFVNLGGYWLHYPITGVSGSGWLPTQINMTMFNQLYNHEVEYAQIDFLQDYSSEKYGSARKYFGRVLRANINQATQKKELVICFETGYEQVIFTVTADKDTTSTASDRPTITCFPLRTVAYYDLDSLSGSLTAAQAEDILYGNYTGVRHNGIVYTLTNYSDEGTDAQGRTRTFGYEYNTSVYNDVESTLGVRHVDIEIVYARLEFQSATVTNYESEVEITPGGGGSTVSVSATGTSTNGVKYITIDDTEYKMEAEATVTFNTIYLGTDWDETYYQKLYYANDETKTRLTYAQVKALVDNNLNIVKVVDKGAILDYKGLNDENSLVWVGTKMYGYASGGSYISEIQTYSINLSTEGYCSEFAFDSKDLRDAATGWQKVGSSADAAGGNTTFPSVSQLPELDLTSIPQGSMVEIYNGIRLKTQLGTYPLVCNHFKANLHLIAYKQSNTALIVLNCRFAGPVTCSFPGDGTQIAVPKLAMNSVGKTVVTATATGLTFKEDTGFQVARNTSTGSSPSLTPPTTPGTYNLQCVVDDDGYVSAFNWVAVE